MAGFALNLAQVIKKPEVRFGVDVNGKDTVTGHLETDFLEHFTTKDTVECRGSNTEVRALTQSSISSKQSHGFECDLGIIACAIGNNEVSVILPVANAIMPNWHGNPCDSISLQFL